MKPYLKLTNISKNFNGFYALQDIDFDIYPGEVHCIAGQNGCGKSTIIKVISGVHKPDSGGTIEINGQPYDSLTPIKSVREGIQVIYQDLSLFPNLTVAENIMINAYHHKALKNSSEMMNRAQEVLDEMQASVSPTDLVEELTISKCQLVAIARALAENAKLIIMDEPTASLTQNEVKHLLSYVKLLKKKGIAVIFVSHKLDEVMEISDRFTVLKDGKHVATCPAKEMTTEVLAELMTGQSITFTPLKTSYDNDVILECRQLTKHKQFSDINFKLHRGEVMAITGLLGAGRTELCLALFGLNNPDSGEVILQGKSVQFHSNREAIEAGIGYVSEDRMGTGLVMEQSIADNISSTQFKALQPRFGLFETSKAIILVSQLIERLKIKIGSASDSVNTLSGGNAQRVSIAKWLAINPKVLILDSPTVGVDIANKSGIYQIIAELSKAGVAVIIVTDEVEEAYNNSHTIVVVAEGKVKQQMITSQTSPKYLAEVING
ncbi:sugar ABC transporter ATP-binding protein [Vibrio sp. B1FLJ16]|uniref:sugar ABC transporter ATP-binding protein n=1 Tax=Vibrio sp. B1FLJ16 TaxID=2751178 RepID=UPI0015F6DF34|nr:sugar ABC transporter ATP-binding protein [Vibrio sp. B1FLJ16]CAD7819857.1 ABC transporter [Vibrio sp. B1FLJ16]CAE6940836.1 ABC transporter [Vibrio sp. B1FLJ16]